METWLLKPLVVAVSDCKQNLSFTVFCISDGKVDYLKTVAVAVLDCKQNIWCFVKKYILQKENIIFATVWQKRNCNGKNYLGKMLLEKLNLESFLLHICILLM